MNICAVIILMGTLVNGATSTIHSAMEFQISSTQVPNFPEFVIVALVNGRPVYYYDSNTRRAVPKQEWMNRVTEQDPLYWKWNTQRAIIIEEQLKGYIEGVRQRLNQTEGLHLLQVMTGCEWDDETDEISGYYQLAFDGQDFIALDWKTETFVAAKSQAFPIKLQLEKNGEAVRLKHRVIIRCVEWLKKLVPIEDRSPKRKELPLVSFLQKCSSSPVTCHATGFYPDRVLLFWAKDGEELDEDPGEILPNHDGTFQTSVSLDLSSVPAEDWKRYSCVFQLSGVTEDLITRLDPSKILSNERKLSTSTITAAVLSGVGVAVVVVTVGIVLYRRHHNNNVIYPNTFTEVTALFICHQSFNKYLESKRLHLLQRMSGCEWDDETDEISGYYQTAFDGQDFIALDWKTETWVAAKPQAFPTKLKWERIGAAARYKNDLTHACVEWLKKFVRFGEKSLKRKELPLVSFLQKCSSSPVTCHATGFYPDRALLFWAKDGEELDEDPGEILPNHDGTFQTSVSLDLSSVPAEDWKRYSCVFQFSGVTEDLITRLDSSKTQSNGETGAGRSR
ncbi:class I histocompatibility antigen, F10 alpha chain-like, partial [Boleophthalmus pectinirostris]|uniref:class I histocompatibility antigen, F10 alpha chain-like n=1 Tax=Boleophthalmus pectinirostris TaxID=150288 RepID=UPI0024319D4A